MQEGSRRVKTRAYFLLVRTWRSLRERQPDIAVLVVGLLRHVRPGSSSKIINDSEHILVIRLDAMGDLLMTTPIFRSLKLHYPDSIVTAVIQESNKAILDRNPYVDRVLYPSATGQFRLFRGLRRRWSILALYWTQLKKQQFCIALQPRLDADYYGEALLLSLVNAQLTVKYVDRFPASIVSGIADSAMHSVVSLSRPIAQHEVLSNCALVEGLSGITCISPPELFLAEEDRLYAKRIISGIKKDARLLCIAFGAQASKRRWPLDRWAMVIDLLAEDRDISVLVICSQAEAQDGRRLLELLSTVSTRLICGATVRQAAACIASCELFLGTDSGLAHLAAAVFCPSLIISPHPKNGDPGHGNSPTRFRPWSNNSHIVQPEASSAPCSTGCDATEPHCILGVTVEQVATMSKPLLQTDSGSFST